MIDRGGAGITDPAELVAVGMRISGRLGWTHPEIAGFLTGAGLDALDVPTGLAPRALRDIQAGQASGRFIVPDADIALSAAAGGLLGLLRMCQRHPGRVTETTVDQLAEAILRLLGVPAPEAAASPPSVSRPPTGGNGWAGTLDATRSLPPADVAGRRQIPGERPESNGAEGFMWRPSTADGSPTRAWPSLPASILVP